METPEWYVRSITVEGYPAWKLYEEPDIYMLIVFVADRFMITTEAETEASLERFSDLIDYDGIAALNQE